MRSFRTTLATLFLLVFSLTSLAGSGEHADKAVLPKYEFKDIENIQAKVDDALARGVENDKLLLMVLGAQWCHDSRGLAQQFSSDEMQAILEERFETVFVNVGYYKDLRELTAQFGYPGYFATPSVMVIDPKTKRHLNMQSMAKWNAADSVSSAEFIEYFSTVGRELPEELPDDTQVDARLKQVQDFAFRETARLFAGFEKLSPLIQAAVDDTLDDDTELRALSDEVYDFRMSLQKDIHRLHKQVLENASSSKQKYLEFPTYGPFSWEV